MTKEDIFNKIAQRGNYLKTISYEEMTPGMFGDVMDNIVSDDDSIVEIVQVIEREAGSIKPSYVTVRKFNGDTLVLKDIPMKVILPDEVDLLKTVFPDYSKEDEVLRNKGLDYPEDGLKNIKGFRLFLKWSE